MAHILINLGGRRLYFSERGQIGGTYPVAIGKPSTPTPPGTYRITRKIAEPGGVLGSRWLELSIPSDEGPYGIHGTPQPWSIGKAVSNGCIRMFNQDVVEIFPKTPIGTTVIIVSGNSEVPGGISSPNNCQYTVQPGDTMWEISRRHGIPLANLIAANPWTDPDRIFPGQVLAFPDNKAIIE